MEAVTALPEPTEPHTTAAAILRHHGAKADKRRAHLGASEIGGPCDRRLWYSFRWAGRPAVPGRVRRLFETGNLAEARFLTELRAIGVEIGEEQPSFFIGGGHFGGSADAVARGLPEAPKTWAIVEMKTHNAKSFAGLLKHGVQATKPEHWTQMQVYMGLAELDRALYLAANKDTDDLYSEWLHFDKVAFEAARDRAQRIIEADTPPLGISDDPTHWQCKYCPAFDTCHGNKIADLNCRTCAHSTPVSGGWHCAHHDAPITDPEGCRSHIYIPALVPYATATDGGDGFVVYQHKTNGMAFANIAEDVKLPAKVATICYTSAELVAADSTVVANEVVAQVKRAFPGAKVTGVK